MARERERERERETSKILMAKIEFANLFSDKYDILIDEKKAKHLKMVSNCMFTLKAPITTAADDNFCDIFPNFRKNKV